MNLPYIAGEIFQFLFFPVMPSCCAQPLLFNYPHSGAGWTAAGAGSKPAIDDGVTNEQWGKVCSAAQCCFRSLPPRPRDHCGHSFSFRHVSFPRLESPPTRYSESDSDARGPCPSDAATAAAGTASGVSVVRAQFHGNACREQFRLHHSGQSLVVREKITPNTKNKNQIPAPFLAK